MVLSRPFGHLSVALNLCLPVELLLALLSELSLHSFLLADRSETHLLQTVVLSDALTGSALYLLLLPLEELEPILKHQNLIVSLFFLQVDVAHFNAFRDQFEILLLGGDLAD